MNGHMPCNQQDRTSRRGNPTPCTRRLSAGAHSCPSRGDRSAAWESSSQSPPGSSQSRSSYVQRHHDHNHNKCRPRYRSGICNLDKRTHTQWACYIGYILNTESSHYHITFQNCTPLCEQRPDPMTYLRQCNGWVAYVQDGSPEPAYSTACRCTCAWIHRHGPSHRNSTWWVRHKLSAWENGRTEDTNHRKKMYF